MRIGLIGEDPNDTKSVINLLKRKYTDLQFKILLKKVTGYDLDRGKRIEKLLNNELKTLKRPCSHIIYVRDLDAPASDTKMKNKRNEWFKKLDKTNFCKGVLMLNVQELEALILADINTFNKIYSSTIKNQGNPEVVQNPKEFLISRTRKGKRAFQVADNPEVFEKLDFNRIHEKSAHFKSFIKELEQSIK